MKTEHEADEREETTADITEKFKRNIGAIATILTATLSVIAIATALQSSGAMIEKVRALDVRVSTLEKDGSVALQVHDKQDTSWHTLEDKRLDVHDLSIAETSRNISDIKSDIRELKTKMDLLLNSPKFTPNSGTIKSP